MNAPGARIALEEAGQTSATDRVDMLSAILLRQGQCDGQTVERGRRVAGTDLR